MLSENLKSITLGQISVFLRVVELESFTTTASEMHMTQSAVSKTIAKIERELEIPLFTRHYHELRVTEEGRMLYSYWNPAVSRISESYESLRLKNETGEVLQIGVTNSTDLNKYFWDIVNGFQNQYETIRMGFNSDSMGNLIRKLSKAQMDIVFIPDFMKYRLEDAGCSWFWAAKDNVQIVLPAEHSLAKKKVLKLDEIKEMTFVTLVEDEYPENTKYIMEMFSAAGYDWQGKKVSYQTPESIQNFYNQKDGFLITDRFFKLADEDDLFVRVPLEGFYNGIICGWDPHRKKETKEVFLDYLSVRSDKTGDL